MKSIRAFIFGWLLTGCCPTAHVNAEELATDSAGPDTGLEIHQTNDTISVLRRGTVVLTYNKRSPVLPEGVDPAYQRSGFLHPVSSPAGSVVTALFPADHRHQDGVFSAWVNTSWNGRKIDFWNLAGGTGRVLHQGLSSVFSNDEAAGFEVDLLHRVVEPPVTDVLHERWSIVVYSGNDDCHCFDLTTTQTALTDIPLIVHQHRYGGVAVRGPSDWLLPNNGRSPSAAADSRTTTGFLNDRGEDRLQGNHRKARWIALTGPVNGQSATISVLCHPSSFRAPQMARLHPSKPYFCFAPCVEGEFVIDRQRPYHARYRVLVTDAAPDREWLEEQWDHWCGRESR